MPGGRKGFYEELQVKKYLSEITPKMFNYVQLILDGADDQAKREIVTKILPKIIDKGLPTMLTGEDGRAIVIRVEKELADKYNVDPSSNTDSTGQTQV